MGRPESYAPNEFIVFRRFGVTHYIPLFRSQLLPLPISTKIISSDPWTLIYIKENHTSWFILSQFMHKRDGHATDMKNKTFTIIGNLVAKRYYKYVWSGCCGFKDLLTDKCHYTDHGIDRKSFKRAHIYCIVKHKRLKIVKKTTSFDGI